MQLDPRAIHISTDGSCYKNPGGKSGCAAIVIFPEHLVRQNEQILDFGCNESTNNRMELMACIKALKWVRENQPWRDVMRVQVVCDSIYVTESISHRARGWKKNNWRNRWGEPMANDDLWNVLLAAHAKAGVRVDFVWNRGKKSEAGKLVDKAAKVAAKRGGPNVDRGFRPGAVCRSLVKGGIAQRYPARAQSAVIRPYAKKIMHRGENRVSFNIFVEDTRTFEAKFYAFATPAMAADLHRSHGYRVQFNDDRNYPQIVERIEGVHLPEIAAKRKTKSL